MNILVLTMGTNQWFFKIAMHSIRNTWAKSLIQGKYKNIKWFCYTECDENHQSPCIDYKTNTIYVDAKPDALNTYDKTKKAYQLLIQEKIEFDYVIRTNTSCFVNVENLSKLLESIDNDTIIGNNSTYTFKLMYEDGRVETICPLLCGIFYGMSKEKLGLALSVDNDYVGIPVPDDVIISKKMCDEFGWDYKCVSPNNCKKYFYSYKGDNQEDDLKIPTNDPSIINSQVFVQLRKPGSNEERVKLDEFDSFYELYRVENQ